MVSTYKVNGQTTVARGISNIIRTRVNQGVDTVLLTVPGAFDGNELFAFNSTVTILKDNAAWFEGKVTSTPRDAGPDAETVAYEISGPWHDLERLTFQQLWKLWDTDAGAFASDYKTRVILGHALNGDRLNAAQVITNVVTYAASCGVNIALGTITAPFEFPWDEALDITCAEAIRKVLRWVPDAVTWFDYTQSPPTLNVKRRSALTAVSVPCTANDPNTQIGIRPRRDLQVPAVVLRYEQHHHVDEGDGAGLDYETLTIDKYPENATGAEIGAVVSTIQLAGSKIAMQRQAIETEALPEDLTDTTWWKTKVPWLNDAQIVNLAITQVNRAGVDGQYEYDNELTKGTIHSWMVAENGESNGVGYDAIDILVSYELKRTDGGNERIELVEHQPIVYRFVATSLETGTYSRVTDSESAEPIPSGAAAALYNAVNTLHYDGTITLVHAEPPGTLYPGRVLNITGSGQAAWASMRTIIQRVTEDLASGRTTVNIGPPRHLGPDDLVELLRANRSRHPSVYHNARETGESYDPSSTVESDGFAPRADAQAGEPERTDLRIYDSDGAHEKAIRLKAGDISDNSQSHTIQAREIQVCEDGVVKKMQILASETYT